MRRLQLLASVFFFFFFGVSACSNGANTKIDASSMEAYKKSIEDIKKKLSPDELKRLDEALQVLFIPEFKDSENPFAALAKLADTSGLEKTFLQAVDKKTPREVIDIADRRVRERQKKELESVISEIDELTARKKAYDESKAVLAKIVIAKPRYYVKSTGFMDFPTIEMYVTNNTGIPLSRIFFHGTVSTPGRSVPWISEDFNSSIPGGIEHGEKKHLELTPNMFSGWRLDYDKKNSVLTVEVVNASDAKGEKISADFSQEDDKRLASLLKSRAELEAKLK